MPAGQNLHCWDDAMPVKGPYLFIGVFGSGLALNWAMRGGTYLLGFVFGSGFGFFEWALGWFWDLIEGVL